MQLDSLKELLDMNIKAVFPGIAKLTMAGLMLSYTYFTQ
jgi:hypothetical protein